MKQDNFKVYGYRWIVLVVFMLIVAATQLLWITLVPSPVKPPNSIMSQT